MLNMRKYSIISLFTGCGGLDLGFQGGFSFLNKDYHENNYEITWANDIDKASCESFRKYFNHEIVCGDIVDILNGSYPLPLFDKPLPERADIVLGGFPCQDFSLAGKRKGFNSKRGLLYRSMVQIVSKTKPLVFLAENVSGLLTMDSGRAIQAIIKDFDSAGYNVVYKSLNAADYGVPQARKRVIIVGTRKDTLPPFEFAHSPLKSENWVNLRTAIGDLEDIEEGMRANHYWSKAKLFPGTQGNTFVSADKPGPTMRTEHHGNIEWHWNGKRRLSAREAARIQSFPDNFVFYPSTSAAYKQIGNAVPPVMAWHIASSLLDFLKKHYVDQMTALKSVPEKAESSHIQAPVI